MPKNTQQGPKIGICRLFSGIFWDFCADPQKDPFWDFFAISGREGPETPVNGGSGRNGCILPIPNYRLDRRQPLSLFSSYENCHRDGNIT